MQTIPVAYCLTYHFTFCDLHPASHFVKKPQSHHSNNKTYYSLMEVLIFKASHPTQLTIKSLQLGNTVTDHPVLRSLRQVKKSDSQEKHL